MRAIEINPEWMPLLVNEQVAMGKIAYDDVGLMEGVELICERCDQVQLVSKCPGRKGARSVMRIEQDI